jgi:hypothetical protein
VNQQEKEYLTRLTIAMRMAFGADKDTFKRFIEE